MDYESFKEELSAMFVEGEFTSRWSLIESRHEIGKLLDGVDVSMRQIGRDIGVDYNLLGLCRKLYRMFPDLNTIPEGKNISWNMLRKNYLINSKEGVQSSSLIIPISKSLKEEFNKKIKSEGFTVSGWVKDKIEEFMINT